jgi:phage baseplate assembly protein W
VAEPTGVYSDINPALGVDGGGEIVYEDGAINSSIENCITVAVGERWFYPDFACHLKSYLYYPMSDNTAHLIRGEILSALALWETRVSITAVAVTPNHDQQLYDIMISWRYRDVARLSNLSFGLRKL